MSYPPGTILTLREPYPEEHEREPYNEVKVIGQSPVQVGVREAEFAGQLGNRITVTPTSFGETIDIPLGELQRDYTVTYTPPAATLQRGEVEVIEPGPTPEEVFASSATDQPSARAERRERARREASEESPEDVFAAAAPTE